MRGGRDSVDEKTPHRVDQQVWTNVRRRRTLWVSRNAAWLTQLAPSSTPTRFPPDESWSNNISDNRTLRSATRNIRRALESFFVRPSRRTILNPFSSTRVFAYVRDHYVNLGTFPHARTILQRFGHQKYLEEISFKRLIRSLLYNFFIKRFSDYYNILYTYVCNIFIVTFHKEIVLSNVNNFFS